ncbi:unnamed protein product [Cylindrotheca closterium]|uniref:Uncharacterized protein n=1 Tax=Cylindrotheca closterium TaxID=2856 RepID=A0AAD2FVZ0_9STRA|nr:unnamed protein product [Cylindrotheca closterium]
MGTSTTLSSKTKPNFKKLKSKEKSFASRYGFAKKVNSSEMTEKHYTKPRANYESKDAASCIFKNEDLVIEIMKFLGVRSMVAFGSCTTGLRDGLEREVKRRKKVFATCNSRVKALLEDANPCSSKVLSARRIYSAAEQMVDDELRFLEMPRRRFRGLSRYPFKDEAQQFMVLKAGTDEPPVFQMLPVSFYFPLSGGTTFQPSTQELQLAMERAMNIVGLQDCTYVIFGQHVPYGDDPNHPFRKFEHSGADFFRNLMTIAANCLQCDIRALESFRIVARKLALSCPRSQDCLHFVLHSADLKVKDDRCQRVHVDISRCA